MNNIANSFIAWWASQSDSSQLLLTAAAIVYFTGVASKFRQYELFCRQTFASLYVTVIGELAPKHKLNPKTLIDLMSPVDSFVTKYNLWAVLMAMLWPLTVPLSFFYAFVAPRSISSYEIALWMSDLSELELLMASVTRFSIMSHSKALVATIAALSAVCPQIGDAVRKDLGFLEGDDNENSNV